LIFFGSNSTYDSILPFSAGVFNNDLGNNIRIVSNYLKIYKDHLAAIKSNTSTKLKNKKNIE
jgi:hypothetical protein